MLQVRQNQADLMEESDRREVTSLLFADLCGAHGIAMSLLILKVWASWRGKGNKHVQHAQTGLMAGDKNCPFHMLFHRMSYTNSRSLVVHQNGSQKDALQILHVTSTATQSWEGTRRVSNSIRFSNIFHHPM